jgi:hypothetical protein
MFGTSLTSPPANGTKLNQNGDQARIAAPPKRMTWVRNAVVSPELIISPIVAAPK